MTHSNILKKKKQTQKTANLRTSRDGNQGKNLLIYLHYFISINERPSVFEMVFSVKTCDSLYFGLILYCVFACQSPNLDACVISHCLTS